MKKKHKWFDSSIVKEDESKTTENSRHFVLNNGTRKAIFSGNRINYFDREKNVWEPIDNSLKATDTGYLTKLGRYAAKFPKNTENEIVEISKDSDLISWEYLGANNSIAAMFKNGEKTAHTKRKSNLAVKKDIAHDMNLTHTSRVVYTNADGDVDLDYTINGNDIKETIVVREKNNMYHYYFLLRVEGFDVEFSEDGKKVEFYKLVENTDDPQQRNLEFIMPAPFMYDSNGGISNEVKYAVEKVKDGTFVFSIEANSDWINAQERVFPVYIDPQLLTLTVNQPHITVDRYEYQWVDGGDDPCNQSRWVEDSKYEDSSWIIIGLTDVLKTISRVHIPKFDVDFTRNKLISAKLIFKSYDNDEHSANVRIGDTTYSQYGTNDITVDITNAYKNASGTFTIDVSMETIGMARVFYIPDLEILYQPLTDTPVRKTFSVGDSVTTGLDVLSGNAVIEFDDITDPVLGVSVSHMYKPNDSIAEYGKNFRLNLDEKLEKVGSTDSNEKYIYTDPYGDVHTFNENFYSIGKNGQKVYVDTDEFDLITADADGRLWKDDTEVFRELTTIQGLRASARLENSVNNAEWVEERLDEEKQAEEQIRSYKTTLCNFVSVNKNTGIVDNVLAEDNLNDPDLVESFLATTNSESQILLSKEEALSYKTLITQQKSLDTSFEALTLQKQSIEDTKANLTLQLDAPDSSDYQNLANVIQGKSLDLEKRKLINAKSDYQNGFLSNIENLTQEEKNERIDCYDDEIALIGPNNENPHTRRNLLLTELELIIEQELHRAMKDQAAQDQIENTLIPQQNNIDEQMQIIQEQENDLQQQLDLYISKSSRYVEQFSSYYKEYLNLENKLDKLKMQVPVAYLISDSLVKGFNAMGNLVVVQDKYGKYVVVERENYKTSEKTRISSVYNQDGKTMSFSYNGNNKLSEICNCLGDKVTFEYDENGYLNSLKRDGKAALSLHYTTISDNNYISKVEFSNKTFAEFSYSLMGSLVQFAHKNIVNAISHDSIGSINSTETELSKIEIEYTSLDTKLIFDGIKQEIYRVNRVDEEVVAYYEVVNGKVTNAERYTYNSNHLVSKVERAEKSCLNRYFYANFNMQIGTIKDVDYNNFKNPVLETITNYRSNTKTEETATEYTYNDNQKLTQKKTTHSYFNNNQADDTTVAVEKYFYNNAGELVRKEGYVEGEELKTGINIEEHVFNDNGVEIQSFSYNSLDPSSKFYTENEVDENGRTLAVFDESGEHKTAFAYERDGVTVKTERLPNGSKLSYGRDKDGTVTALTHSTENGDENSTTQICTLDVVTEVKSGNNTVQYTYDNKRRVKTVSLNGVDDYLTYAYSGEHTDAEKVTATMANGTIATSIKNAHGNVTKITVGSKTVTNTYDADQLLTKTVDSVSGTTDFTYTDKGNVETVKVNQVETERYSYDDKNVLTSKTVDGKIYTFTHKTTADKALESISVDGKTVRPQTDALGRNTGKTIEVGNGKVAEEKISYVKFGDHATSLPSNVRFATNGVFNESIQYKYDSMGNIIEVFENGRSACRYEYDALGRLIREDNVAFGKTTTWAYDNNGNILARYEYTITAKPTSELHLLDCVTKLYTYDDSSDQLMSYNGEAFVYDTIGNPTTYRGKAATWAYGRQLATYDGNTFAYDARGRRTAKNGIAFTYDSNGNLIKQSNGLEFFYDHTGVFAVKHNNTTYFYRKDAQANIVALLDNTGAVVVKYKYDAWGKCNTVVLDESATEIATLNPFRYRSYYLDTETGFYFLKTRYYDPEIGRFMTIDDISYLDPNTVNGLNLYVYCFNNPVMFTDRYGCTAWWEWLIAGVIVAGLIVGSVFTGGLLGAAMIGAAIGAGISLGSQALFTGQLNWGQFALDIGVGAITGLLGVSGISQIGSMFAGAGISGAANIASQLLGGASISEINWLSFGISVAGGALSGWIAGAGTQNVKAVGSSYEVQLASKTLKNVQNRIASGTYYATTRGMKSALTQANNKMALAVAHQMSKMFTGAMVTYGIGTFLTVLTDKIAKKFIPV